MILHIPELKCKMEHTPTSNVGPLKVKNGTKKNVKLHGADLQTSKTLESPNCSQDSLREANESIT